MVQKIEERIQSVEKYWSKILSWNYYDVNVNKYGVKCGTLIRFWDNKGWINEIDPYGRFQWYFGTGWLEDRKMMKDKLIDGKNC